MGNCHGEAFKVGWSPSPSLRVHRQGTWLRLLPAIRPRERISPSSFQGRLPNDQPRTEGTELKSQTVALPSLRPEGEGDGTAGLNRAVSRLRLELPSRGRDTCWDRVTAPESWGPHGRTDAAPAAPAQACLGYGPAQCDPGQNHPRLNPAPGKVMRRESEQDVPEAAGGHEQLFPSRGSYEQDVRTPVLSWGGAG